MYTTGKKLERQNLDEENSRVQLYNARHLATINSIRDLISINAKSQQTAESLATAEISALVPDLLKRQRKEFDPDEAFPYIPRNCNLFTVCYPQKTILRNQGILEIEQYTGWSETPMIGGPNYQNSLTFPDGRIFDPFNQNIRFTQIRAICTIFMDKILLILPCQVYESNPGTVIYVFRNDSVTHYKYQSVYGNINYRSTMVCRTFEPNKFVTHSENGILITHQCYNDQKGIIRVVEVDKLDLNQITFPDLTDSLTDVEIGLLFSDTREPKLILICTKRDRINVITIDRNNNIKYFPNFMILCRYDEILSRYMSLKFDELRWRLNLL